MCAININDNKPCLLIMKYISALLYFIIFFLFYIPSLKAQTFQVDDYLQHSVIFTMGEEGYHNYRIPSVVQAKNGTLIAIVEGRRDKRGDPGAGHIDLVYKLSFDGGRNWSLIRVLVQSRENWAASNPTVLVDSTNGRIFVFYAVWMPGRGSHNSRPGTPDNQLWMRYSDDHGMNWSAAEEITRQGKDYQRWGRASFGPGHGIQLQNGRLIVPMSGPAEFDGIQETASYALYSDDGGKNWIRGGQINAPTNENTIVELRNGDLLMDARPRGRSNARWVAISKDRGESWGDPIQGLISPVIHASIIRYFQPDSPDNSLLIWSGIKGPEFMNRIPGHEIDYPNRILRTNLVMRVSVDQGKTFPAEFWIHKGPAAYSVITLIEDYGIGVIWEGGNLPTGTVNFTRIPKEVIQVFLDLSQRN